MTMAICIKCGERKWGAFNPCARCGTQPGSEDELALSLAMSDHYFDDAGLDQLGDAVRSGKPPHLSPASRETLIASIRDRGVVELFQQMKAADAGGTGQT